MARIAFFGTLRDWEEAALRERLLGHDVLVYPTPLSPSFLPEEAKGAEILSVFVDAQVSADVIAAFPNLKGIVTRSTGYDHIDLDAAAERGVVVANVPSYGENTVAEHAFGLLLALSKRIVDGYDMLRERGEYDPSRLTGFDLKGRTLGVVGTGRIGQHAIRIGNGFQMRVVAYDAYARKELEQELHFTYTPTLEDLLRQADVLTLHVPYLPATHHLINKDNIRLLPKGAVIINTSRGPVVETEALFAALVDGHLAGAGLDVVEEEGFVKDEMHLLAHGSAEGHNLKVVLMNHKLIDMPNVIMTPHSAFNTREALERILRTSLDDIDGILRGEPVNVVQPSH
ncbi:hydroxyacid dehydrogenase [Candidatus Parcubacteria bacterium]|nr:MAG: hydroxyacid dehydrogenase [Candidatus Parcubacteria bacterium]GIW69173.1 MAG: lactate dehydrogenase [Candidatus Parcubacteria bacterium]